MNAFRNVILATLVVSSIGSIAIAQPDDEESLKMEALQALMSAPPERALPIVAKVLKGNGSDELKEHALFVLGQLDLPEARALLIETARTGDEHLRHEAIRAIGIGGEPDALKELGSIYTAGDEDAKEAVLEAYLIADYRKGVYDIAAATQDPDEFEMAVEKLGAMGATEELRLLRDRPVGGEALIHAYAIAGDIESLTALATDSSNPERQMQAMHGLGIAGGDKVGETLVKIYRSSEVADVKSAALHGLMIADDDEAVLELYHSSNNAEEKRELLQMLVNMDSDAVWSIIDQTLEDKQ
jgi:HEAT repeat protein